MIEYKYIYIYIDRERERERERWKLLISSQKYMACEYYMYKDSQKPLI